MDSRDVNGGTTKRKRRIVHWVVVAAFVVMVFTGLTMYVPAFSGLASGGWTRLIHRAAAVILVGAPIVYAVVDRKAAWQWLKEAVVWRKDAVVSTWKKTHKSLMIVGFLVFALTGMIQWFLKGVVSRDAFQLALLIHDIAFFSAIVVLLYHVYYEFDWWLWKRRVCSRCDIAYCAMACPTRAITASENGSIERDPQRCNNCRLCMEDCRRNSYYKKGAKEVQAGPRVC